MATNLVRDDADLFRARLELQTERHRIRSRRTFMKLTRLCAVATLVGACVITLLAAPYAQAQTYKEKVLHSFTDGNDGGTPEGGAIQDALGNLYGTTTYGGSYGGGTVFKLNKTGKETVLYSFCHNQSTCTDGQWPYAGVVGDAQGNLYGTTGAGGAYGEGVVFKLSKTGVETVLHSFGKGKDGAFPLAGVIGDAQGNLYGTTRGGGDFECGQGGCGVVFKLGKTGKEAVYNFTGGTDGAQPFAGVIRDAQGNLYGTAAAGGAHGDGVVFKLSKTGVETTLYSFSGGTDGIQPEGGVITDGSGNFYGTTYYGGDYDAGTVFKLSNTGTETVLYTFTGKADGGGPVAGVILDAKGNLYGTTYGGGDINDCAGYGCGVVFKLDTSGTETVLYSFTGGTDGGDPDAGVTQDANGNLCGTTYQGGDLSCGFGLGCGVVFELTP
jgi:uncharacterized repeat protein (TIGR03803 family)